MSIHELLLAAVTSAHTYSTQKMHPRNTATLNIAQYCHICQIETGLLSPLFIKYNYWYNSKNELNFFMKKFQVF